MSRKREKKCWGKCWDWMPINVPQQKNWWKAAGFTDLLEMSHSHAILSVAASKNSITTKYSLINSVQFAPSISHVDLFRQRSDIFWRKTANYGSFHDNWSKQQRITWLKRYPSWIRWTFRLRQVRYGWIVCKEDYGSLEEKKYYILRVFDLLRKSIFPY